MENFFLKKVLKIYITSVSFVNKCIIKKTPNLNIKILKLEYKKYLIFKVDFLNFINSFHFQIGF